jgi:hypothetical protein
MQNELHINFLTEVLFFKTQVLLFIVLVIVQHTHF